ncbi:MAG: hypothetical protein ACK4VW_06605, partial [Anaerolineales bacterium]
MEIPQDELIQLILRYLPDLLRTSGKVAEEIKTIWSKLRTKERVAQAARDLVSNPDDPDAQAAFRFQLRKALAEDPSLAAELAALLPPREIRVTIVPPAPPERPRPFHNLPRPDYVRFVGRQRELAWLRQRLSPADRAWIMVLTGIGGVGKTALAL